MIALSLASTLARLFSSGRLGSSADERDIAPALDERSGRAHEVCCAGYPYSSTMRIRAA